MVDFWRIKDFFKDQLSVDFLKDKEFFQGPIKRECQIILDCLRNNIQCIF